MRQPYTYTMPEQFLTDSAVPARWRVWAILNGFFLNKMKFWGSNDWIGEKIGAHKDTISQAIKELEELNYIKCERTRRSRIVIDIRTEIGDNAYLRPVLAPISDRRQRLTNTDSNAEREKATDVASFSIVPDEPIKVRPKRDSTAWKLKEELYDLFEKEYDHRPTPHIGDYKTVLEALKRLEPKKIKWLVEEGLSQGKHTVRECLTARAVDAYLHTN